MKGVFTMNRQSFDFEVFGQDGKMAERLLRNALENAFESMMVTTAEAGYPVIFVNPAFTELTGYEAEEVMGKTPALLQGPKTDDSVLEKVYRNLAEGKIFHGKTVNYRKDGSEFMMEWKIIPIRNDKEEITHFLAVQREATA